jgi:hypothetical protein
MRIIENDSPTEIQIVRSKTAQTDVIPRTAGHLFSFVLHPFTQRAGNIDFLFPRLVSLFIYKKCRGVVFVSSRIDVTGILARVLRLNDIDKNPK